MISQTGPGACLRSVRVGLSAPARIRDAPAHAYPGESWIGAPLSYSSGNIAVRDPLTRTGAGGTCASACCPRGQLLPVIAPARLAARCGLGRRQARDGNAERRRRDVVETGLMAELDRSRIAAVLAADADFQTGLRSPPLV